MYNLKFQGGCNGNLKAIGKLCEGKDMKEIADILDGNTCNVIAPICKIFKQERPLMRPFFIPYF